MSSGMALGSSLIFAFGMPFAFTTASAVNRLTASTAFAWRSAICFQAGNFSQASEPWQTTRYGVPYCKRMRAATGARARWLQITRSYPELEHFKARTTCWTFCRGPSLGVVALKMRNSAGLNLRSASSSNGSTSTLSTPGDSPKADARAAVYRAIPPRV
jgi:hypothetical protein